MIGRKKREEFIRTNGIDGTAKLGEWWIIGKSGGALELVEFMKFELEITVAGGSSYTIKHRQLTPYRVYSVLNKGMILPIKVHPDKPEKVLLDWDNIQPRVQVMESADLPENVLETLKGLGVKETRGNLKTRLRELEEAHQEGLLTADEYNRKRTEMLKEL